jgi:hypothetical protein
VGGGVQTGSTRHVGHLLAYCTCTGWLWEWRIWWNEWQGKPKYSEKTCPDATLSTINSTWPDPELNPGRRGGKSATNRFSYGAAMTKLLLVGPFIYLLRPVPLLAYLVEALCYKPEGSGFYSRWRHRIFQMTESFQPHYGPGVDSASDRNAFQESSWS